MKQVVCFFVEKCQKERLLERPSGVAGVNPCAMAEGEAQARGGQHHLPTLSRESGAHPNEVSAMGEMFNGK